MTGVAWPVGGPMMVLSSLFQAASSSRRSPRWGLKGLVWGHQLLGLDWWYGGWTVLLRASCKTRCFTRTIAFKSAWSWCNTWNMEHWLHYFQLDEPYLILVLKCRVFSLRVDLAVCLPCSCTRTNIHCPWWSLPLTHTRELTSFDIICGFTLAICAPQTTSQRPWVKSELQG